MGRLIGAVIVGYVTIFFVVFGGLSLAWAGLGADGAFRPGVYDVSTAWVIASFVVGFIAALIGGRMARRIAQSATGPRALAVVVVLLGIALAIPAMTAPATEAGARPETLGMFEAMQFARTPLWIMLVNPLVGAIGVLLGGRALRSAEATPEQKVTEPPVHR